MHRRCRLQDKKKAEAKGDWGGINRFLNRLLAVKVDTQTKIFQYFMGLLVGFPHAHRFQVCQTPAVSMQWTQTALGADYRGCGSDKFTVIAYPMLTRHLDRVVCSLQIHVEQQRLTCLVVLWDRPLGEAAHLNPIGKPQRRQEVAQFVQM